MPGLFDNPMALMQLGGSLMAAGQEQPYGVSRGQVLAQGIQGVGNSMAAQQQMELQKQAFEMQKQEFEAKRAAAAQQQQARQAALGAGGALFGPPQAAGQAPSPASGQAAQPVGLELQQKPQEMTAEQRSRIVLNAAAQAEIGGMPGLAGFFREMAKPQEGYTLAPGATRFGPDNKPVAAVPLKPEAGSALSKLIDEKNALPEGDPRHGIYKAAIEKAVSTPRMHVKVPDGKGGYTEVSYGSQGGSADSMTNKTQSDIEGNLLNSREGLVRLNQIKDVWRPEFSEIGTRLQAAFTSAQARMGMDIPPEDKKLLQDMTVARRRAAADLNQHIKTMAGTAVSGSELERMLLEKASIGTGIWDGDDPVTFKAKLDDSIRLAKAAVVRYEYYKSKGIESADRMSSEMPLDSVRYKVNPETGQKVILVGGKWQML